MAGLLLSKGYVWKTASGKANGANVVLQGMFESNKNSSATIGSCSGDIVLVTGVTVSRKALVAPVEGVDSTRVLYVFGESFGSLRISAIVLPGGSKYKKKEPKKLIESWEQNSVISKDTPVNVSWAGLEMKVYLMDTLIEAYNPESDSITCTFSAVIAPITNKNQGK